MSGGITIGKWEIRLIHDTQLTPQGRPFRFSGIEKTGQSKWINGTEKWHWIYTFRYLDIDNEFFKIQIGYNDEFIKQF